jgi:hypothetical protein
MRNESITDEEATALLRGETPNERADLQGMAAAFGALRGNASTLPPPPSAELAAFLVPGISASPADCGATHSPNTAMGAAKRSPQPRRRRKRMIGWIASLSLATKIGIGAATAAVGVTVAGVAEVLPPAAQDVFDQVITIVTPFDRADDTRNDEGRGDAGRERAAEHHAEAVAKAEAARAAAEEKRQAAFERASELRDDATETGDEVLRGAEAGLERAAEKGKALVDGVLPLEGDTKANAELNSDSQVEFGNGSVKTRVGAGAEIGLERSSR